MRARGEREPEAAAVVVAAVVVAAVVAAAVAVAAVVEWRVCMPHAGKVFDECTRVPSCLFVRSAGARGTARWRTWLTRCASAPHASLPQAHVRTPPPSIRKRFQRHARDSECGGRC
eukprot:4835701-Pleurochrysis_carterae.AAC.1